MYKFETQLLLHLQTADARMRELFGFYWHRRHFGISSERMDALVREIKTGERILKKLKKEKGHKQ